MKRGMKSGSDGLKKPKLYEIGSPRAGSSTTIASWPKRSQKIWPGCIVTTPMRGACAGAAKSPPGTSVSNTSSRNRTRLVIGMHADMKRMQSTRIGARDAETEATERQFLAGFRQVSDRRRHQAADGVVFVIVEISTEALVEVGDRRQCIHDILAVGLRRDQRLRILGLVVFVIDVSDDLLEHVLDRDQSGDATVLVDHDRHVVARLAELAQQHVEFLRFRAQPRRPQQCAHGPRAAV